MLKRLKFILLLAGFKMCCITGLIADCSGDPIHLLFNLDSCAAVGAIETADYSEFVPIITESSGVRLTMVSNSLYRINPEQNRHSCTPGRNGTPAMCISSYDFCFYQPGSYPTVRFDVMVTPLTDESARITNFSFFQKAPEMFEWIDGASGTNNYPTLYGVRVLRDNVVVYEESNIPTTRDWTMSNYDFTEDANFKVDAATNFSFELIAYCPVGIISGYHVWDLEDIRVDAICEPTCDDIIEGATVTTVAGEDNISICDDAAIVQVINTSATSAFNYLYILTDINGMILNAQRSVSSSGISFQMIPAGTYYIYGASLATGKMPASGSNISEIIDDECESLSTNRITVERMLVTAGTLSGGPVDFCIGDGHPDIIQDGDITITGAMGESLQWVITDITGTTILHLPNAISDLDFETLGLEDCLAWTLSYSGMLEQLEEGGLFSCITGCMKRSNFITINKTSNKGGTVTGGPISLCIGDDVPDYIEAGALTLTGNTGSSTWVVTDGLGNIETFADDYSTIDFSALNTSATQLWHLSYDNKTTGLEINSNISSLDGCYDFSNPVTIEQEFVSGGSIAGGPFYLCVGNGESDFLPAGSVTLSGNVGAYSQWVVTDVTGGNILYLPDTPYEVDFNQVSAGTCDLWHLSYNQPIEGLEIGGGFPTLRGCLGKSNFIEISRYENTASSLTAGAIEFCIGDDMEDIISDGTITLTTGTGANQLWLITDENDVILSIPPSYSGYNFNHGADGNHKIYHLTYDGPLGGLMGGTSLADLDGCFSLSNAITVTRNDCRPPVNGGNLTGGPFSFCQDGMADYVSNLILLNNEGTMNQWVITDSQNNIQDLPGDIYTVDFESVAAGRCLIYNVSYEPGLTGLMIGNNLDTQLLGDYAVSNAMEVLKGTPNGGMITGGPYEFCTGNGQIDAIPTGDIQLTGNTASNSEWIITDATGSNIIGIVSNPSDFDFDKTDEGTKLVWHISYEGTINNLAVGKAISDLSGCFGLSNSITVLSTPLIGGTLEGGPFYFCVNDGIPDMIPAGAVSVTNNTGTGNQWMITDVGGTTILELPDNLSDKDYDNTIPGNCILWNVSYLGSKPSSFQVGGDFTNLGPCTAKSDFITLFKVENIGGIISSDPIEFCVGDGAPDYIREGSITLNGNVGNNSQWIITDRDGIILNLPLMTYSIVDFDLYDPGTCYLTHMSYDGPLTGFSMGNAMLDIGGCYKLSNSIPIKKTDCPVSKLIIQSISTTNQIILQNIGNTIVDATEYSLVNGAKTNLVSDLVNLCADGYTILPGESMIFHTSFDLSTIGGEVALYVNDFQNENKEMVQYLTWGNPEVNCTPDAVRLGLWEDDGTSLELTNDLSLIYDGEGISASDWYSDTPTQCELSDLSDISTSLSVRVHPNPATNLLNIEIKNTQQGDFKIELISKLGQVIMERHSEATEEKSVLTLEELESGMYYLRISTSEQSHTESIIKL